MTTPKKITVRPPSGGRRTVTVAAQPHEDAPDIYVGDDPPADKSRVWLDTSGNP